MTMRNKFVKKTPTFFKGSVIALFCRSEIIIRTAATEVESLNARKIIGFWGGRVK